MVGLYFINLIFLQNTFIGLLTLAVLSTDASHLTPRRTSFDDLVDPLYPPLDDYHHTHHGYDIGLTSKEEYAADFPESFDHQIHGHEVNSDLSTHTLDYGNQFDTLSSDYKPIHEDSSEDHDMLKFENKVFHQVPAPRLGNLHQYGFDTEAQDFSDLPASQHYEPEGRSYQIVHQRLFSPSQHHQGVYDTGHHLEYANGLLK